jgi:hypothetical protein
MRTRCKFLTPYLPLFWAILFYFQRDDSMDVWCLRTAEFLFSVVNHRYLIQCVWMNLLLYFSNVLYLHFLDVWDVSMWTGILGLYFVWLSTGKSNLFTRWHECKTQWPKGKVQKDKQRSTKQHIKLKIE